jgi:hypothetical protein
MARARLAFVLVIAGLMVAVPRGAAVQSAPPDPAASVAGMTTVSDHRYRASGAARPFVLFWISRDNVGGARITRRRGNDGRRALEMLTGSDPARAPFGTNRWGYIQEIIQGNDVDLVAVKTPTEEETIEDAKASVRNTNARGVLVFIREHVTARESVAWSTVAEVGRDVTFRDLDAVLRRMPALGGWQQRRLTRPPDARPGFLTAFADMMDASAKAWASGAPAKRDSSPAPLTYIHRAELFDLHQDQVELVPDASAGGGERVRALRARFRIWNRRTSKWSGEFVAVYGISGAFAGVPLRLTYQPRWWLRTELAIDDTVDYSAGAPHLY